MDIENEVAIVTGGYSGIGAAVVKKLLSNHTTCIILARNKDKADRFIKEQKGYHEQLDFFQTDISHPEQVRETLVAIKKKYGSIQMLVNAAGINVRKPALEFSPEEWKQIVDINLNGTFYVSQAVARIMKEHNGGRVVNIGSMISHYGIHNVAAYAATKGGINQLTRALAVEWAEFGIRVNQVSPGYILTPLTEKTFENSTYKETIIRRTPLGRLGTTEDVANMVIFLLSKETAFVTGQMIAVDGGILGGDPTLNPLRK